MALVVVLALVHVLFHLVLAVCETCPEFYLVHVIILCPSKHGLALDKLLVKG